MAFEGLATIGQIHLSVSDVDASVAFYRDVLGLPLLFRVPRQPMAFFDCDGVRLYIGQPETEDYRTRGMVYFSVPDLGEAFATLSERGVTFMDEPHVVHKNEHSEIRMAFFRDLDDNNLALMAEVALDHTSG
jgi:catechol 2,3-dioxygenase-like lactoylglutathione lyase family enzyme